MSEIKVIKGDITKLHVDAIVNAANNELMGGGGVDGAIHRAGGPVIMKECRKIGYCKTGEAVMTSGGKLPAKHVIHTVGPVWKGGKSNEPKLLDSAYNNSMKLAFQYKLMSLAFPNISTGVYGFPKKLAAKIAVDTIQNFLFNNEMIMKVLFVCYDDENYSLYSKLLK